VDIWRHCRERSLQASSKMPGGPQAEHAARAITAATGVGARIDPDPTLSNASGTSDRPHLTISMFRPATILAASAWVKSPEKITPLARA
jgi:hypothetical protein